METKYLLVQWPESQSFIGVEGCFQINPSINDKNLDGAMFVPEEIFNETYNITATSEYVKEKLYDLINIVRQSISRILMDTSEENPKECHITLESPEDCGLSSLQLPTIIKVWQHPSEGWITFEFIGNYRKEFEELDIYEMLQVLKGLEDENSNTSESQ